MAAHSPAFTKSRDLLLELEEPELARLSQLFGAMNEPKKQLGPAVRDVLRSIAALDDDDLERLVGWFTAHVNRWGQMPRSSGLRIAPTAKPTQRE